MLIDTLIQRCLLLTSQLLAQLVTSGAALSPNTVHDMRVATKRLRAAWQLLASVAPEPASAGRRRLRAMHKTLAANRRAHVLHDIAQNFLQRKIHDDSRAALQAIDAALPTIELGRDAAAALGSCLRIESQAWRELRVAMTDDQFVAALVASYRRARSARENVTRHPGTAEHHQWRRRVKRLLYQLELLPGDLPAGFADCVCHLRELAEHLGRLQDFGDLAHHIANNIADESLPTSARRRIKRMVEARMQRCRRRAQSSGRRALRYSGREFGARVAPGLTDASDSQAD